MDTNDGRQKGRSSTRRSGRVTKLEAFLRANNLKPSVVAREAKNSRQHFGRIRKGKADPTITTATKIRDACSRLTGQQLNTSDLFDV